MEQLLRRNLIKLLILKEKGSRGLSALNLEMLTVDGTLVLEENCYKS